MKKLFLMLCVALVSVGAFAQKGEQRVGLNLNYGTEVANVGLGAKYQYGLTDAIRLEGGFDYFFKRMERQCGILISMHIIYFHLQTNLLHILWLA